MRHFKLILTDEQGTVCHRWTIGKEIEFDIEDVDAEPEHDFYLDETYQSPEEIGESIISAAEWKIEHRKD